MLASSSESSVETVQVNEKRVKLTKDQNNCKPNEAHEASYTIRIEDIGSSEQ